MIGRGPGASVRTRRAWGASVRTRRVRSVSATTLVEVLVAAPIGLGALGVGLVLCLSWLGQLAVAVADPALAAMPVLEAMRRDVREAREVVYPRAGDTDLLADALVLRARDGTFIGWRVTHGALEREVMGRTDPRFVRLAGVQRVAVRRLGGKKPIVRVGLLRPGRSIVLMSAMQLAAGS